MDLLEKSYGLLIYDELEEYESAIARLTEAIEQGRANTHAYNNRGVAYFEIGEDGKAQPDYEAAIRVSATNAIAYANLARLAEKNRDFQSAIAHCDRAIEIEPDEPSFRRVRAFLHLKIQNPSAAIADFSTAIELDPGFKNTYWQRAETYDDIGRHDLAELDRRIWRGEG